MALLPKPRTLNSEEQVVWNHFSIFLHGASVAVYDDGRVDTTTLKDKALFGLYQLADFGDRDKRNRIHDQWVTQFGEARADEILAGIDTHAKTRPSGYGFSEAEAAQISAASERFMPILLPAQLQVPSLAHKPLLWLAPPGKEGTVAAVPGHHYALTINAVDESQAGALPDTLAPVVARAQRECHEPLGPDVDEGEELLDDGHGEYMQGGHITRAPQKRNIRFRNTRADVRVRRGFDDATYSLWVEQLLRSAETSPINFGDLMRELRVLNGLLGKEVTALFDVSRGYIGHAEVSYPSAGDSAAKFFLDNVLTHPQNPYHLPVDESGHVQDWAETLLKCKLQERITANAPTQVHKKELHDNALTEVKQAMRRYQTGAFNAAILPNIGTLLYSITPRKRRSIMDREAIVETAIRAGLDVTYQDICSVVGNTRVLLPDNTIRAFALYSGCTEEETALLLRLPRGKTHHFAENYQAEMTEPRLSYILNHPEDYEHAGKWLAAMARARQISYHNVASKMGLSYPRIQQQFKQTHFSPESITHYTQNNPFDLPAKADGSMAEPYATQFQKTMRDESCFKKYGAWPTLNEVMNQIESFPVSHSRINDEGAFTDGAQEALRAQQIDIYNAIFEQAADAQHASEGYDKLDCFDVFIDGRPLTARIRPGDGAITLAPESVEILKTTPSVQMLVRDIKAHRTPPTVKH